jgi:Leucine-rich repeat (LRR) protein
MEGNTENLFQLLCSPVISNQLLGVQLAHSLLNVEQRIELSKRWLKFFSDEEISPNFLFPNYKNGQLNTKREECIYAAGILSDTLESITLRHWQDSDLPNSFYYFKKLKVLNIEHGKLSVFLKKLDQFPCLTELTVLNVGLTTLPDEIGNAASLEVLNLKMNYFQTLGTGISRLKNLKKLSLEHDRLTDWKSELENLSKLKNFEHLEVIDSACEHLPSEIGLLENLKVLDFQSPGSYYFVNAGRMFGNCLVSVAEEIGDLKKLEYLCFKKQAIKTLPNGIGNLKNLKELNLSYSGIEELPETLGDLEKLEKLDCYKSALKMLPESIGELKYLKELIASDSQISIIPETIGKIKSLEALRLSRHSSNKTIADINFDWICQLDNLRELELSNLNLRTIPSNMSHLKKLIIFTANFNQIKYIDLSIFGIKTLNRLSLNHNMLFEIPAEIANLTELTLFSASVNKLKSVPEELFQLEKLEKINLTHNRLEKFEWNENELKSIKSLLLNDNRISHLSEKIADLKTLNELEMLANPLESIPIDAIKQLPRLFYLHLPRSIYTNEEILAFREQLKGTCAAYDLRF